MLKNLVVLALAGNEIGDGGAVHFAKLDSLNTARSYWQRHLPMRRAFVLAQMSAAPLALQSTRSNAPRAIPPFLFDDANCLPRLRRYLAALEAGTPKTLRDVKVMILGNGQIGKTQLRRALCGAPYKKVPTTHGVEIAEASLPPRTVWNLWGLLPLSGDGPVPLKIWDFGGQDIYLGTHALFLRSRAVFPILWKANEEETHKIGAEEYDNYPLDYWLRYVLQMAGEARAGAADPEPGRHAARRRGSAGRAGSLAAPRPETRAPDRLQRADAPAFRGCARRARRCHQRSAHSAGRISDRRELGEGEGRDRTAASRGQATESEAASAADAGRFRRDLPRQAVG